MQSEAIVIPTVSAPCDIGISYAQNPSENDLLFWGGNWQEAPLVSGVALAGLSTQGCMPTTRFLFGAPTDIGLMFGQSIATYGTDASGDRLGRFFIDRNNSNSWDAGDTFTRFMPNPQASDQPFTMSIVPQQLIGGHCQSTLLLTQVVVGIKRGSAWYIDANENGVWDGTANCDIQVSNFGSASDIPTPVPNMIAVSRHTGPSLEWFFDTNHSFSWSGAPPDSDLTAFGTSSMRAFSDSLSGTIGAENPDQYNGDDVYIDKNGNHVWDGTPTDIGVQDYVPAEEDNLPVAPITTWRFVGWFTANPPNPPNPPAK
jgi:hypothetical protein